MVQPAIECGSSTVGLGSGASASRSVLQQRIDVAGNDELKDILRLTRTKRINVLTRSPALLKSSPAPGVIRNECDESEAQSELRG